MVGKYSGKQVGICHHMEMNPYFSHDSAADCLDYYHRVLYYNPLLYKNCVVAYLLKCERLHMASVASSNPAFDTKPH